MEKGKFSFEDITKLFIRPGLTVKEASTIDEIDEYLDTLDLHVDTDSLVESIRNDLTTIREIRDLMKPISDYNRGWNDAISAVLEVMEKSADTKEEQ